MAKMSNKEIAELVVLVAQKSGEEIQTVQVYDDEFKVDADSIVRLVDASVLETPVVETPVVETPVVLPPVVLPPVVNTPVVETPVVETSVVNDSLPPVQ